MNPAPFCTHSFTYLTERERESKRERKTLIEFSVSQLNHWICPFICPDKVGNALYERD